MQCLKNLDYPAAVALLRPYRDYNAALAFASAGYDHSAWDILAELPDSSARLCYIKALVLSRLGMKGDARKMLLKAIDLEPSMRYRANLDPEMDELLK